MRRAQYIWDLWGEQVAPLGNHIPYMVTVGTLTTSTLRSTAHLRDGRHSLSTLAHRQP
jgi:hypothetical protein